MSKKHHHTHQGEPGSEHANAQVTQEDITPSTQSETATTAAGAPQSVEELQKKTAQLEADLADLNDKMLRFKAEAENTRRRATLDIENANKFGVERLARELLDVVDSLEHGLEAFSEPDQTQIVHLREGMQLTHKLLLDTLYKFQIKQLNPKGESFDPKQHEALTAQPTADMEPNKVLTVVQKGYIIHDRMLRPARVIVSKTP